MEKLTTEQQKDVDTRVSEFLKRHQENAKELQADFAMVPEHVQIAPNVYATQVKAIAIDTKFLPKQPVGEKKKSVIKA